MNLSELEIKNQPPLPPQQQLSNKLSKILDTIDNGSKKCAYCFVSCGLKCSKCSKVGYCGSEHQKLHRQKHKDDCFPAIKVEDEQFGFYLAATRTIKSGEVIFTEHPLVISPYFSFDFKIRYPVCLGCCKVLHGEFGFGSQICQQCSWPLCNKNCEKILWHSENECKIFKIQKIKPSILIRSKTPFPVVYDSIKVLRILLLKESNPTKFEKLVQLECHKEARKKSDADIRETKVVVDFIHHMCGLSPTLYPEDLIYKMYGIVQLNSCEESRPNICPDKMCESAIYEKTSKLCHNCVPNTKSIQKDTPWAAKRIITTKEIIKGEMLTECYGFNKVYWLGNVERRQGLQKNYYFWCTCSRCSDPTELGTNFSAIKCKQENKGKRCSGFYLPINPLDSDPDPTWICDSKQCKSIMKYSILSKIFLSVQKEILKAETVEQKLKILKKHSNVSVHENHFTMMKLRFDLIPLLFKKIHDAKKSNAKLDFVDLSRMMKEFTLKCLELADKLAPGLTVLRGILLFYLSQVMDLGIREDLMNYQVTGLGCFHSMLVALEENISVRDEAKLILKELPEGSPGNMLYKLLVGQDPKSS